MSLNFMTSLGWLQELQFGALNSPTFIILCGATTGAGATAQGAAGATAQGDPQAFCATATLARIARTRMASANGE